MTRVFENGSCSPVTVLLIQSAGETGGSRESLPEFLNAGAKIDVIGRSKGHGFTGVIQRHGFSGLGAAHGVKKVHRSGGSVGQNTEPGRVHPGTKMAGRHGNARRTVRNLRVVLSDSVRGIIAVAGSIPGHRNSRVKIRPAATH